MRLLKSVGLNLIVVILLLVLVSGFAVKAPEGVNPINVGQDGENKKYELKEGQSITITYGTDEGKQQAFEYPELKADSDGRVDVTLNEDGRVVEAHFKSSKDQEYVLGNQLVFLPEGAEVDFSEGEAKIKMPADAEMAAPRIITGDDKPDATFSYQSANGFFKLERGNLFKFQDRNSELKFDGNYYFDNGLAKMNNMQIINDNGIKTYVDFNGKINGDYDGAYISIKDGTFVTGSNIDKFGPKINFLEGNKYGLRVKAGDHFSVQALGHPQGNYVRIVNRDSIGKIPKIDHLNEFGMNVDGKTVHYNSEHGKLFLSPKTLISGFVAGKSSVPVELHSFRTVNGKFEPVSKVGNVLGITDDVEFAYGKNPGFIQTTSSYGRKYSQLKKGFSNSWLYYNIKGARDVNKFLLGKLQVYDSIGALSSHDSARMVVDIFGGLTPEQYKAVSSISFQETVTYEGRFVGGLASPNGEIWIPRNGFDPETIRHEITHTRQFQNPGAFWADWQAVGYRPPGNTNSGPDRGFTYGYGMSNYYEDGATTGEFIYQPSYWDRLLKGNTYSSIYRGKLAVLRKYNFITENEYKAVFGRSGLDSSPGSVQKYINEARAFVRR